MQYSLFGKQVEMATDSDLNEMNALTEYFIVKQKHSKQAKYNYFTFT
jgi:hypothetical protein